MLDQSSNKIKTIRQRLINGKWVDEEPEVTRDAQVVHESLKDLIKKAIWEKARKDKRCGRT